MMFSSAIPEMLFGASPGPGSFPVAADPRLAENSRTGPKTETRTLASGCAAPKSQTTQRDSWHLSGGTASVPSVYLYDGPSSLEQLDEGGNVLARYTRSSVIDEWLAELQSGTTSYYEQDGLRSITSLSSSAGALANTYSYDSYGKLTASTGTIPSPFQYTGREYDSESGLYYYRARYLDQSSGRFVSGDPALFNGLDTNLYRYVLNRPTSFMDPSGLVVIDPNFNSNCLPALQRAINILRHLPKKCDCAFRNTGSGRSLSELVQDPNITIHFNPEPGKAQTGNAGVEETGYTLPGDTSDIWLRPITCRWGRWSIAQTLVHELTHITLVPGGGQEDEAEAMEANCGLFPLPTVMSVSATGNSEVPTIPSTVPDFIPEP